LIVKVRAYWNPVFRLQWKWEQTIIYDYDPRHVVTLNAPQVLQINDSTSFNASFRAFFSVNSLLEKLTKRINPVKDGISIDAFWSCINAHVEMWLKSAQHFH
jgi:hypothetical protein